MLIVLTCVAAVVVIVVYGLVTSKGIDDLR
jgi:hypothetical protein